MVNVNNYILHIEMTEKGIWFFAENNRFPVSLFQLFQDVPAFSPLKKYYSSEEKDLYLNPSYFPEVKKQLDYIIKGWPGEHGFKINMSEDISKLELIQCPSDFKIKYAFNKENLNLIIKLPKDVKILSRNCFMLQNKIWVIDVDLVRNEPLWMKPIIEGKELVDFVYNVLPRLSGCGIPIVCDLKVSSKTAINFNVSYVDKEIITIDASWGILPNSVSSINNADGYVIDREKKTIYLGVTDDLVMKYFPKGEGMVILYKEQIPEFISDIAIPLSSCFTGDFEKLRLLHGSAGKMVEKVLNIGYNADDNKIIGVSVIIIDDKKYKVSTLKKEIARSNGGLIKLRTGWISSERLSNIVSTTKEFYVINNEDFLRIAMQRESTTWDDIIFAGPEFPDKLSKNAIEEHFTFITKWRMAGGTISDFLCEEKKICRAINKMIFDTPNVTILMISSISEMKNLSKIWFQEKQENFKLIAYENIFTEKLIATKKWDVVIVTHGEAMNITNRFYLNTPITTKSLYVFFPNRDSAIRFYSKSSMVFNIDFNFALFNKTLYQKQEISINNVNSDIVMNDIRQSEFLENASKFGTHEINEHKLFVKFHTFMPDYNSMTDKQREYYIYWRTQIRQGVFYPSTPSYILIYLQECACGVYEGSAGNTLELMINIWNKYGNNGEFLIIEWIVDFALLNNIIANYHKEITNIAYISRLGKQNFINITLNELFKKDVLQIPANILKEVSGYEPRNNKRMNSVGYDLYDDMISKVVSWTNIYFIKTYSQSIFRKIKFKKFRIIRRLFIGSIVNHKKDYSIEIFDIFRNEEFIELLIDISKLTENIIRQHSSIKGKMKIINIDSELIELLTKLINHDLNDVKEKNRKEDPIVIDFERAKKLEKESDQIRDLLISSLEDDSLDYDNIEMIKGNKIIPELDLDMQEADFIEIFDEKESAIIKDILHGGKNVNSIADKYKVMPAIIIDSINEKAMDYIGDIIIDISGGYPQIIDDYTYKFYGFV